MSKISKSLRQLFVLPLVFYKRFISPLLPAGCIYTPTCSVYIKEAILRYGIIKGGLLGALRILRCNPLFKGGKDFLSETTTLKSAMKRFGEFWIFRKEKG